MRVKTKKLSRLIKQPSHVAELRKLFKKNFNTIKERNLQQGTHSSVVEHSTADREVSGSNPLGS